MAKKNGRKKIRKIKPGKNLPEKIYRKKSPENYGPKIYRQIYSRRKIRKRKTGIRQALHRRNICAFSEGHL